jgi:hypothetical protein
MAKVQNRRKKSAALIVAAGMTVAGTGVAYAYWTALGEGGGNATTGESVNFVIAQTALTGEDLYPGGPAQTSTFTVTNPGDGVQTLGGVGVEVANADGSAWTAVDGCSAADFEVALVAPVTGPIAADEALTGTATVTMVNSLDNQDACQDVTVPLHFEVTAPAVV